MAKLFLSGGIGKPGEIVRIAINVAGFKGPMWGADIVLRFMSGWLTYKGCVGGNCNIPQGTDGVLFISITGEKPHVPDGPIAFVDFEIAPNAPPGVLMVELCPGEDPYNPVTPLPNTRTGLQNESGQVPIAIAGGITVESVE